MPLTPHEQRILEEIEKRLAEEDPRLVESVARATVTSHALRRIRWGIAGFVVGGGIAALGSIVFGRRKKQEPQSLTEALKAQLAETVASFSKR